MKVNGIQDNINFILITEQEEKEIQTNKKCVNVDTENRRQTGSDNTVLHLHRKVLLADFINAYVQ